ncbi:MAG: TRAP transporter small permease [Clostridiales bacterium]|nr:TRAP transporter small permease [Clostridiales bacterium]MDY3745562.1 TRAP transporter small permease [Lachnospiraceae bacterium]
MRGLIRITQKVASITQTIVMVAVVVIMLLTVTDVVLRHTVNIAIVGVTEYSQMLMAIIMLATGATAMSDGHIKVDILMSRCNSRVQNFVAVITCIFSAIISGLMAARSFQDTARSFTEHQTYTSLGLVKWPFFGMYAVSLTVLCLAAVALIVKYIHLLKDNEEEADHE